MTIFLVILAILLVGGTALLVSGRPLPSWAGRRRPGPDGARSGRSDVPGRDDLGLVPPVASLPPVLLPAQVSASDVDAVRFGLGLRGYRMDQVDEVLDRLAAALTERDDEILHLRAQLAERDAVR
ncbi:DivIVA domain-containing protein [uncultured Arthrobacter sp.]|uniref:DivIVA domain-containing protein n=1 Tax=uncultured Arthrobacter sp. TaxID=114050 RepID=UPI002623F6EA|nr:DivIVA domain-containing protein [uncultured Arthrobacter sp.]